MPHMLALSLLLTSTLVQEPSKASLAYRLERERITVPPYGLSKVQALIKKIKEDSEENSALPAAKYGALSFQEKFTYNMIHGETYSQNCDAMPVFEGEENKIFAYPPDAFNNEHSWSERQQSFFKNNRAKVIALMRESINRSHRVGVNYKSAIYNLSAVELIPDIRKAYLEKRRDHDILTLLNLLMKEAKYKPFTDSRAFHSLYSDDANYLSHIDATRANQDMILKWATGFHSTKAK